MGSKFLSVAETAKLVRAALREAFPNVKFSVRSRSYSGGAAISVRWLDGPSAAQVESIAKRFQGAYFDGMADFQGSRFAMIDGQVVQFGADFIHCGRLESRALCEKIAARFPGLRLRINGTDDFGWGFAADDFEASRPAFEALARHSDRLRIGHSPTAARVIYLGNDGYSEVGALAMPEDA